MSILPDVQATEAQSEDVRPLDPNVLQRMASDPVVNIWVNASAGTGKTKVLTDRVLRLLLPRDDGAPATHPQKILGITFTKAGANEMVLRVNDTLRRWVILPEDTEQGASLKTELRALLGRDPNAEQLQAARRLFTQVMSVSGGLKIMTIHSFCQSVLGRFPLEAGIAPDMAAMDESESAQLLLRAQNAILQRASQEQTSQLSQALNAVALVLSDDQLFTFIQHIMAEQHQLKGLLKQNFGVDGLYSAMCDHAGIVAGQSVDDFIEGACDDAAFDRSALMAALQVLLQSDKATDQKAAATMADFYAANVTDRVKMFDAYCLVFLKQDGDIRASVVTQFLAKKDPALFEAVMIEAARIYEAQDRVRAMGSVTLTRDLLLLATEAAAEYERLKHSAGALDYNDMIYKTLSLLQTSASWVLYKLDQGIDHILVDEAQDTNPEQWQIIKALSDEFFAGESAAQTMRSVFVVGDQKQSIYGFQRASPQAFHDMRSRLEQQVSLAGQRWKPVELNISFRSTQAVLGAVDCVFADDAMQAGLAQEQILHHSFRRGQAGLVELWPVFETEEAPEREGWMPSVQAAEYKTGADKLADYIADMIKSWLEDGQILESHGRPIRAGDIMILMRSRSHLVHRINRALRLRNIPTSGTDRMALTSHIAVQDCLALARFVLLPADDLTLCCVLKSPLIGLDEQSVFDVSAGREGTVWASLRASGQFRDVVDYLDQIIAASARLRPFELFSMILNTACPASDKSGLSAMQDRLGPSAAEPLYELLHVAMEYERKQPPHLQLFLSWLTKENYIIKRETDEAADHVRIMTIHGAKGLQAPIVILPDTMQFTQGGRGSDQFLWPDKTGLPVPLWAPRSDMKYRQYGQARQKIDQLMAEEYNRLLYVAMTRAEDRLYIGGHAGKKPAIKSSWYFGIQAALSQHPDAVETDLGGVQLVAPQTAPPDRTRTGQAFSAAEVDNVPAWLFQPVQQGESAPRVYNPSRMRGTMEGALPSVPSDSALVPASAPSSRYDPLLRGHITHKLLEVLPALPPARRQPAAESYIARYSKDLPEDVRAQIIQDVMGVLDHPDFHLLFTGDALAEVPIVGVLPDGRHVNGVIDRVLVTESEVWLVDYKTGVPPADKSRVPRAYREQMEAYTALLRTIYPEKSVKVALLWTDGPVFMPDIVDAAVTE